MQTTRDPKRYEGVELRLQVFAFVFAGALVALGAQLWHLQVVRQGEFAEMAEANRIRPERLKSDRGVIYGRDNVILADNRGSVDIVFVPGDVRREEDIPAVCARLEQLLGVDAESLLAQVEAHSRSPFTQLPVKRDVTPNDRTRVEEHAFQLPGVYTVARPQRRYHYGKTAGQILGYLGEISRQELEAMPGYQMGDIVGKSGLERMYEELLQGRDGFMLVTKYASGRPQLRTDRAGNPYIARRDSEGQLLSEIGQRRDPTPGQPLHLTLDIGLQSYCESLLQGEVGAIVALDADTGAVLAMASNPNYDPSVFVTRGRGAERLALLNAPNPNPMRNRGYTEQYPPGSVYKILMAGAALEEGVIDKRTTFWCPGYFQINGTGRRWHCHRRSGHGHVAIREALAYSCDCYFYNVGLLLGIERMVEWSHRLGMGVRTGIDLPGEVPGNMPTPEQKAERFRDKPIWERRWYPGDTVNVSIGQGDMSTTPLQNAVLMASVLNGGYRVRPYLNRDLGPAHSARYFSEETVAILQDALRFCVEDARGTGRRSQIDDMVVLGKTGTAQIMSLRHHERFATPEDIPYHFRHHAWYVAGVLDREPKLAVCVLVEHGHAGGAVAAPLARDVFEFFYNGVAAQPLRLAREGVR